MGTYAWRKSLVAVSLLASSLLASCARTEVERFVEGAPLHGANGIIFDAQDRLHIGSVLGREIVVMDRESGAILDRIGSDRGVEGPDDVIFDPDGTLYWTSILTGEVGSLSPTGEKRGQMVAPGVNPITISDDAASWRIGPPHKRSERTDLSLATERNLAQVQGWSMYWSSIRPPIEVPK